MLPKTAKDTKDSQRHQRQSKQVRFFPDAGEPCTGYPTTSIYAPVNGFPSWATLGDRMCFRCAPAVLQGVEVTGTEH